MAKLAIKQSLDLFESDATEAARPTSGAFTNNMKLPVHRWFRYSAGFSAEWAASQISQHKQQDLVVLDPFAGSGTVLLEAQKLGARGYGYEAHEFVARIAQAKLSWHVNPSEFQRACANLLRDAQRTGPSTRDDKVSSLLARCYDDDRFDQLLRLRLAFDNLETSIPETREQVWLAITSILRECSHVGTAQWQYILPNKSKSKAKMPFDAFSVRSLEMYRDMISLTYTGYGEIVAHDARSVSTTLPRKVDLVITSPPYPNNYDYADATRLEMTFWGEISGWSELHPKIRRKLVTSCSQHASADRLRLEDVLSAESLAPIRADLTRVCLELAEVRETKGGKKAYHTMIAAYFRDLADVWLALRSQVRAGGRVLFVIGDSAPYGVYVPVDEWFGTLALSAGFRKWDFVKWRDRNTKWKNRKHQVPLKEGLLTVEA